MKLGQSWEIQFPFLTGAAPGKVEYISNRVDPGTHAVRVRTSIPNPEGRLKSDMLVRGLLEIPPDPAAPSFPARRWSSTPAAIYVYVKLPGRSPRYRRVPVTVAQEKDDHVVHRVGPEARG